MQRLSKIASSKRKKYGKYYDVPTSNSGGRYVDQEWRKDFDDFQTGIVEVYGNYTFVVKLGGGRGGGGGIRGVTEGKMGLLALCCRVVSSGLEGEGWEVSVGRFGKNNRTTERGQGLTVNIAFLHSRGGEGILG